MLEKVLDLKKTLIFLTDTSEDIDAYFRYITSKKLMFFSKWTSLVKVSFLGMPVKILKALPHSSILATRPAHLNILDLITLNILGGRH